jgi:hypothetical protein
MKQRILSALLVFLLVAGTALGQEKPRPSAELALRRIVLFSSGVGYLQREGEVEGNAGVQLSFRADDINDLLKSLVVQDRGGRVGAVHYDSRDPIERTLKSFAVDLTTNPTLGELLNQVRGERVEIGNLAALARDGQPQKLTGVIVGVQTQRTPAALGGVTEFHRLNLLTDEGLRSIALDQVQQVRFLKAEVEREFRQALGVLASAHDRQKKTVTVNFLGAGKRTVRVGYVIESPMWKTSYRLSLEKDGKAFLQGWAIVENTSDDDWKDVRLSLVSGRPISFEMDLYEPLYVPRPIVEPELFAWLRPRPHQGAIWGTGGAGRGAGALPPGVPQPDEPAAADRMTAREKNMNRFFKEEYIRSAVQKQPSGGTPDIQEQIAERLASAAFPREVGEFFHYDIEQPVSLPRQKSALLPIVNNAVEVAKVSIFNEEVHLKHPMLGLRLNNTSALHLMQGPITVFDAGSYAGDAQIETLQPKETRLVSYAVDLGTEVVGESKEGDKNLITVQVSKGILRATHRVRHSRTYTVKNRSPQARTLLIEHPFREKWALISPEKPAERTRDLYRFEVKAAPDKSVRLEVVEDEPQPIEVKLSDSPDDAIRLFIKASVTSASVRQALDEVLKRRGQLAETQRGIQSEETALAVIAKDQERMRNNMERVPKESDAFKRYLKKFDEQETEIEKRRERITTLQETAEQQRKELEKFVAGLEVQ